MSKKRFVEFYLAAMLKAATNGRVTRLVYTCVPAAKTMTEMEIVTVYFANGSCVPVSVAGDSLLEISRDVLGVLK